MLEIYENCYEPKCLSQALILILEEGFDNYKTDDNIIIVVLDTYTDCFLLL